MIDRAAVQDLFDKAVQLAPVDRTAYLDQACQDNHPLRREVERLLGALEKLGEVFEPTGGTAVDQADPNGPRPPRVLGAYRILHEIGRGGAGAVYLAARRDDAFNKAVAIKLLHPGLESTELVRRFRHERQILASIDHQYVAKLLDGGSTADGLPYLVMEYVEGLPIDRYCDRHALSTSARLKLFCKVCEAVQFAHQHLVVHRDIKPGNVLVTADGVPKLLDFGIAKLLDPSALSLTIATTEAESRLMTPEYASPEQVRGEPVTTASDVYSLGVLLYRLLTGRRPYRLRGGDLPEITRAICEQEPTRPSAAFDSDGGDARQSGFALPLDDTTRPTAENTPERLRRRLQGDLDNIVLRAIRKEPHRRYTSAEQLADDIARHLADLPVRARPDTVRYRATKFVRRHRAAVAIGAAFVLFVVAAATALSVQAVALASERNRAEAARQGAEREAARATAINDFLLRTLGAANPMTGTGRDVTLVAALNSAAIAAQHTFADQPEVEAGVLNVVGMTLVELGRYDEAAAPLERALTLRRVTLDAGHLDVAQSLESKATLLRWQGKFGEAEALYREALRITRNSAPDTTEREGQILQGLGLNFSQQGDETIALSIFEEGLSLARNGRLPDRVRAELLGSAGVSHRRLEHYDQAAASYREALAIQRGLLGPNHPEVGTLLNNLAVVMNSTGKFDEAEALNREAMLVRQIALGKDHPYVANSMVNLAVTLEAKGNWQAAADLYEQAASIVRASLGPNHPRLAQILRNWGVLLANQSRTGEALPLLREALRIRRAAFKEESRDVADALTTLAFGLRAAGSLTEAEALNRKALAINIKVVGPDSEVVADNLKELGSLLCSPRPRADALDLLAQAAEYYARRTDASAQAAAIVRGDYGECLTKALRFADAEPHLLEAHREMARLGLHHRWARQASNRLNRLYATWGKPGEAAKYAN